MPKVGETSSLLFFLCPKSFLCGDIGAKNEDPINLSQPKIYKLMGLVFTSEIKEDFTSKFNLGLYYELLKFQTKMAKYSSQGMQTWPLAKYLEGFDSVTILDL